MLPDAIHDHARRQRVLRTGDILGQFQPSAAFACKPAGCPSRECSENAAALRRPDCPRYPANERARSPGDPCRGSPAGTDTAPAAPSPAASSSARIASSRSLKIGREEAVDVLVVIMQHALVAKQVAPEHEAVAIHRDQVRVRKIARGWDSSPAGYGSRRPPSSSRLAAASTSAWTSSGFCFFQSFRKGCSLSGLSRYFFQRSSVSCVQLALGRSGPPRRADTRPCSRPAHRPAPTIAP